MFSLTKEVLYQLLLTPHSIPFKDSERSERQKELEVTVIQLQEKIIKRSEFINS